MVTALLAELLRGQRAISLRMHHRGWRHELASDILKVARPASLNPLMNVATILGLTALVGQFGTQALAGYGIGTRIEFVMLPVIFAFGTALTTIVGTNIGAGNYERAELAGRYGMTSARFLYVERLAAFWPCFPIFGYRFSPTMRELLRLRALTFALSDRLIPSRYWVVLYFASQGAGTMTWPIPQILRFAISVGGAFFLVNYLGYGIKAVFIVTVIALASYAGIISIAVFNGAWRPKSSG